jgi:tetratricopeptide (TPR) repeat protein
MMTKKAILILSLALLSACALNQGRPSGTPTPEQQAKLDEAAGLLARENYAAFKEAFRLYGELSSLPGLGRLTAPDYFKASILLGVREKDLGIFDAVPLNTAGRLIAADPRLAPQQPLLDVARILSHRTRGIVGDVDTEVMHYFDKPEELDRLIKTVTDRARTDVLAAYLLAEYQYLGFARKPDLSIDDLLRLHPSTRLIAFVRASTSQADPKPLEDILVQDPECKEAYFFLGNVCLSQGLLLQAERNYEAALEAIPESPQITVSLAGVAFAEEEFERSIDYFDKTLAFIPDYREAILGKAISLTYLGRSDEAMVLLQKLIDLGNYLQGEAHFWLAWNLNELKRYEEGHQQIEEAKKLLGQGQVFSLSGLIDLGLGQDEQAKSDFLEALKYNPADAVALSNLSGIYARQHLWDKAGSYGRTAGDAYAAQAESLNDKLTEIKTSSLPEARKARLLKRKTAQVEGALLAGATAYYNAGAAFLNAGDGASARPCLLKAASHPAVKVRADELAAKIKRP